MSAYEVNFDGLVGPTHNYAGLSVGNVASLNNAAQMSNPKEAALQGLAKMKALSELGLKQGILPPLERPDVFTLRQLGFSGSDEQVLKSAYQQAPQVFVAACSASSMWTANACTTSPSADAADNKVHFTAANLANKFHRSIESPTTARILQRIFNSEKHFAHHRPLPLGEHFGDEGAANHTRFCTDYHASGVEFFVFGQYAFDTSKPAPLKFPARQSFEASDAIARLHQLDPSKTVFAQQNPKVIDQGVFHNDVISVGNKNVLFYHQQAFLNTDQVIQDIRQAFGDNEFYFVEVPTDKVPVIDAVKSYLFNSQLVTLQSGEMAIIAPSECEENNQVKSYLDELIASNETPIKQVKIYDVKQSMQNGGGPACLRQRVVLNDDELAATEPQTLLSEPTYNQLKQWVNTHYRDRLSKQDLVDPQLLIESRQALDELTQLLNLGSVYPFQLNERT